MAIAILFMRAGTVSFIQVCRYLISHQVRRRGEDVEIGGFGMMKELVEMMEIVIMAKMVKMADMGEMDELVEMGEIVEMVDGGR